MTNQTTTGVGSTDRRSAAGLSKASSAAPYEKSRSGTTRTLDLLQVSAVANGGSSSEWWQSRPWSLPVGGFEVLQVTLAISSRSAAPDADYENWSVNGRGFQLISTPGGGTALFAIPARDSALRCHSD